LLEKPNDKIIQAKQAMMFHLQGINKKLSKTPFRISHPFIQINSKFAIIQAIPYE
jgi:hypothetical protein